MSMGTAYAIKKKAQKCAEGGFVNKEGESLHDIPLKGNPKMMDYGEKIPALQAEEDADMIARILHKRKGYSDGGMVANDTPPIADDMPADFDDLALRDDLEDDSSAGNEEGDIISKVMRSRGKR